MSTKKFLFLLFSIFFLSLNLQANQVVNKAKELGVMLSGKYIDESMKNKLGKYVLPSRDWMKKYVNNDRAIFYREGGLFGDLDGNGKLDYITWGTGKPCQESQQSAEGRIGCSTINAYSPPFQVY